MVGDARSGRPEKDQAIRAAEMQLCELQHRVKNTMHLLGTLLRKAEREVSDPGAKATIRDVASKVAAVGALERLVSESSSRDRIEVLGLARVVSDTVLALAPREAVCVISGNPIYMRAEAATTLALIINELLTNSVKHARGG